VLIARSAKELDFSKYHLCNGVPLGEYVHFLAPTADYGLAAPFGEFPERPLHLVKKADEDMLGVVPTRSAFHRVECNVNDSPQPPQAQVERISTDALFPFDQGDVRDIRPAGLTELAKMAARIRGSAFTHVEVFGYADRLGPDTHNLTLSRQRADSVKIVLIKFGVPAEKIRSDGMGSQDPIVQCENVDRGRLLDCLEPNRRVEIATYITNRQNLKGDTTKLKSSMGGDSRRSIGYPWPCRLPTSANRSCTTHTIGESVESSVPA
jgi:outer membrane protein OmpA-like peptidoglycan-associated protein